MIIRQARLSDLDRILEIELENFSIEEAIPRSVFEVHLKEIKTSFLVAEKDGEILGYIEGPVIPHRYLQDQSSTAFLAGSLALVSLVSAFLSSAAFFTGSLD